jgi:hypothetical protein
MEEKLINMIRKQRSANLPVNYKDIIKQAMILAPSQFKISSGWLSRFKKLNKVWLRVPTKISQKLKDNSIEEIKQFLMEVLKLRLSFLSENKTYDILDSNRENQSTSNVFTDPKQEKNSCSENTSNEEEISEDIQDCSNEG